MITLFAIPKKFTGHIEVIQRNAIQSWTLLHPRPEIILLGDDAGTEEIAREFHLWHLPKIARNSFGTPLISDLFRQAKDAASSRTLCYVNSDIILMNDFLEAVESLSNLRRRFLMVGRRWDMDITRQLPFGEKWQEALREEARAGGRLHNEEAMDYFAFPRDTEWSMPQFAIGRPAWDNWLIYRARKLGLTVADATEAAMIVHQNHDYSHVPQKEGPQWEGPEARVNRELAGGRQYIFTMFDATHRLTSGGLKRARSYLHLRRHFETLHVLHPPLKPLMRFLDFVLVRPFGPLVQRIRGAKN